MAFVDLLDYSTSKLGPPYQASDAVLRPRLLARLRGRETLILVIAPAGTGKTALLSSWASMALIDPSSPYNPVNHSLLIWYGVDSDDREPRRLVDGLAAAIDHASPGLGQAARLALARGAGPFAILSTILASLERQGGATIFLDDCHYLDGARGAEDILDYIVRYHPATVRLIMASRTIPAIPTLAASAAQDLVVLGRDALLFTSDEAADLLTAHGLSVGSIHDTMRATNGWAMGMLLLARANVQDMIFLGQPADILAEYLMTQIVDRLAPAVRRFLLESSLLGWFTTTEADQILQRHDSQAFVNVIVRQVLFVDLVPDTAGTIARYHDVFAASLSAALQREDPTRWREIHERAAGHRTIDPLRALRHISALDDAARLADALDSFLPTLRIQNLWDTAIHYITMIPAPQRSLTMLRYLSYAYYIRGDDGRALETGRIVYERAVAGSNKTAMYSALVLQANCLVRQDRCAEALAMCLPALDQARQDALPEAEGWLASLCADALMQNGQVVEGRALFDSLITTTRASATTTVEGKIALARTLHNFAVHLLNTGDDIAAHIHLDEAADIADQVRDDEVGALCLALRAELFLVRGQDVQAREMAQTLVARTHQEGNMSALLNALVVQALACTRLGHIDEALTALGQHETLTLSLSSVHAQGDELIARAHLCLAVGDRDSARVTLQRAKALALSGRGLGRLQVEQGILALAEGRMADANRLLDSATKLFAERQLRPDQAGALILHAEALVRLGKDARAVTCLTQAGNLAIGHNWVAGLEIDSEPSLGALRALSSYWRLQGKGRELAERLRAAAENRRLRLVVPDQHIPALATHSGVVQHLPERYPDSIYQAPVELLRYSPFGEGRLHQNTEARSLMQLRGEKGRELLAFAIWAAHPLSRDDILNALWDGRTDDRTQAAFRTASYQIRRFLGPSVWLRSQSLYTITRPIDDEFRTLLTLAVSIDDEGLTVQEQAALGTRALDIYTGPFLSWCYSPWTEQPRALTKTAILTITARLCEAQRQLGQPVAALQAADRGLLIDPSHDMLRQMHMRLLIDLGRPGEALDSYRKHIRYLAAEGLGPASEELRSLNTLIRRS